VLFRWDHLLVKDKPGVLNTASPSSLLRCEERFAPTPYGRRIVVSFDSFISLRAASRVNYHTALRKGSANFLVAASEREWLVDGVECQEWEY
jgi:hypothetical protein